MNNKDEREFDNYFNDGVFAVPSNTKIKVRALYKFCKENNIAPDELTEEQIAQFIEKRDK